MQALLHRENALQRSSSRLVAWGPSTLQELHYVELSLRSG